MNSANRALIVFVVATLGIWGCARGPAAGSGSAERIRALEAKIARLEDDFRGAATARDQFRRKLAAAEEVQAQLRQEVEQLQVVVKERDDLRIQVKARTGERDVLQGQYDQFRKGLRDLLGQAEAAASRPAEQTVTSTAGKVLLPTAY
jgi:septal ring factor EnvC (AmiA/AmiB activator)